jgi:hypothetical protein
MLKLLNVGGQWRTEKDPLFGSLKAETGSIPLGSASKLRHLGCHQQSRFRVSKMIGALDEIDHMRGRMNRQRMLGKAGPRGNIACHFTSQPELGIRSCCKQGNHEVL